MQTIVNMLIDNSQPDISKFLTKFILTLLDAIKLSLAIYVRNYVRKIVSSSSSANNP